MTPNELLLWLSARKDGSWPQFRGAVEALDLSDAEDEEEKETSLPLHQRVRFNLERLGHVEFDAAECEEGWRVVPPTLALSHHDGAVTGVLCGARTPRLMANIQRAASTLAFEEIQHPDCPTVVRVHASEAGPLLQLARSEGLLSQVDTPAALLSHLPSIDAVHSFRREALPQAGKDWDVKRFVIEKRVMKWQSVSLQDANAAGVQGLFRFTRFQIPHYFLREGKESIRLPGPVGKYRILSQRGRRTLRYDRRTRKLTLPAILRPPLLTERALILCSGFPPALSMTYKRPTLTYRDIPEEVMGIAAEKLRQDLR
jgi:hypothetical protein